MHVGTTGSDKHGSDKQHTSRPLAVDAAAGALAGAISRFVVGPLDVVKIRFQVQLEPITLTQSTPSKLPSHYTGFVNAFKTIIAEEGVRGLWTGTVPGLLLTIPYTAVQFVALQQCKQAAARLGWEGKSSTIVSFTSGALAGAAATVASYPFDLLRTTLAAQGQPKVYKGMRDAASAIYRHDGLPGLYRGLGVTLIEIMPYAALQFGLYDAFNQLWEQAAARKQRQLHKHQASQQSYLSSSLGRMLDDRQVQAFTCGLAAGLLAKLGSHPLDVAKKRYQVAGLQRSLRYGARVEERVAAAPLLSCLADIYTREGVAGLWKGSVPSIVKAAPAAAITFTAYEVLLGLMVSWLHGSSSNSSCSSAIGSVHSSRDNKTSSSSSSSSSSRPELAKQR